MKAGPLLIELLAVFGLVLFIAVHELRSLREDKRKPTEPPSEEKPPSADAPKP